MSSKMDALLAEVNKKVKEEIIFKGLASYNYNKIPFTSPRANYCTYGGVPIGKVIEFYGAEHGGKTTSALDQVGRFQELERKKAEEDKNYTERDVFYCDVENTLDSEWAKKFDVDVDRMYLLQPKSQSAEQIFDLITDAIETGDIGLVVLDSIAAMVSQDELDKDYDEKSFGGISGPLSRFAKKIEMLCAKYNCTLIGINQVRDDVNSTWGGYKTPGGRAWKHICIMRVEFSKGQFLDENGAKLTNNAETPSGTLIQFKVVKNKTCPPDRRVGFYTIDWNGVDYLADLIEVAILCGVIVEQSKGYFVIPDISEDKIHGKNNVRNYLAEHTDIREQVDAKVNELIQ
jgi:recombination protein RecA